MSKNYICQICNKPFKNLKSLATHYNKNNSHLSSKSWGKYKQEFIIQKNHQCRICDKFLDSKGLGWHLTIHDISIKEYYDNYLKKPNEDNCIICNDKTKFKNVVFGYRNYCSRRCHYNDIELSKIKSEKQSITKRNIYNNLLDVNSDATYFLYILKHPSKPIIKIGRTTNLKRRLYEINRFYGECTILHQIQNKYTIIQPLEIRLHKYFDEYCKVQSSGDGRTEWFDECITKKVIEMISK